MNRWRAILDRNPNLSDSYRTRYAQLLAELEAGADPEQFGDAERLALSHASKAVGALVGVTRAVPKDSRTWHVIASGSHPLPISGDEDLDHVIAQMPELEQTRVPVHPSRHAHAVPGGVVALRWSADSVPVRTRNAQRMQQIVETASRLSPIPIQVWTDYTIYAADRPYVWAFTANHGTTVEDLLRDTDADRGPLLAALRALRAVMLEVGLIWQGFAPRNMFLTGGRLVLIDFEELVDVAIDPIRAAECLLWHQVFFADCLEDTERELLLGQQAIDVPADTVLTSDSFERALTHQDTTTWARRRELLLASAALEGRHRRPDGSVLFGHELGHFWGDFVQPSVEAAIFRSLTTITEPADLTACMEVFQAAMEADIIRIIRQNILGDNVVATPRTDALTGRLTSAGWRQLAAARRGSRDWYTAMLRDPTALVDSLLFKLGVRLDCSATARFLVGATGTRPDTQRTLDRATGIGLDFLHPQGEPVLRYTEPDQMRDMVAMPLPRTGADIDNVLGATEAIVAAHSISQSHPGYLAFPDSANSLAAIAGSVLGRFLNQNLIAVDRSAPAATFVEIQVIEWLRELAGYDSKPLNQVRGVKDVGGLWTTGGHLSNHVAMLAALGTMFPHARRDGLRALDTQPSVIMSGPIAHYSHSDAAFHLGLGWDAVLPVAATPGYTTDVAAVEKMLADPPSGRTPFMVVGVAGNCRTTGLDDLAALGEICQQYGVWFHVDACHGGSLIFSQRLRARHLAGIEQADSISLDPHKGLFTPYPSSYVLFKDRGVLTQFSRHEAMVQRDDCWDLGLITPFLGSRGFESLATWMMLRHIGVDVLGQLVEDRQALVRHLERRLDATGLFVRLNDVDFYRLAFVFCPPAVWAHIGKLDGEARLRAARVVSDFTSRLNALLYQGGEVCFDEHTLADLADRVGAGHGVGYTVMGACPGNLLLTQADLDTAVQRTVQAASPMIAPMLDAIRGSEDSVITSRIGGPAGWSDV